MIRKILSLITNIIAVTAAIIGLIAAKELSLLGYLKYFTTMTNFLILLMGTVSIGYAIDGISKKNNHVLNTPLFVLKLITAVCSLITFVTVVAYLEPLGLTTGPITNIPLHYVAPLAFIFGFIFLDIDRKYNFKLFFFGIAFLIIYMGYCIPLSNLNIIAWGEPPYPFMDINKIKWLSIPVVLLFLVGGLASSLLLWFLNRLMFIIFIGNEISEEEIAEDEKEYASKVEVTKEDEQEVISQVKQGYTGPKIYHISKRRNDKMWQVKFANGKKAIKLFNTQAEAIVFAKKLADSQEGSIRIHSLKGKIRKEH